MMKAFSPKQSFWSWITLFAVVMILGCSAGWLVRGEEAISLGNGSFSVGTGDKALTVFTYKPRDYHGGPMLLVFHGMTRTAENYLKYAIPLAEKRKLLVVAPLFDRDHFPGKVYNYGGVKVDGKFPPREEWIYQRVPEIIDAVRTREGKADLPYYMIGHSAGAQFVMRYAALMPPGALHMVAANPGSDLFPRRDWEFGYGFGGLPKDCSDDAALQRYLAAPLTVYLGQADIDPQHPELDRSEAAEREGKFRLERGRACFEFARKLAEQKGWKFSWRKVEVAGIAHSGRQMFQAKEAEEALFGGL
jgi:poly(3-hydroxybutyrate) depolymerase